jgi:hypothetical protein
MIKPDGTSRRKRIEALKANLKKGIAFQKVSRHREASKTASRAASDGQIDGSVFGDTQK